MLICGEHWMRQPNVMRFNGIGLEATPGIRRMSDAMS